MTIQSTIRWHWHDMTRLCHTTQIISWHANTTKRWCNIMKIRRYDITVSERTRNPIQMWESVGSDEKPPPSLLWFCFSDSPMRQRERECVWYFFSDGYLCEWSLVCEWWCECACVRVWVCEFVSVSVGVCRCVCDKIVCVRQRICVCVCAHVVGVMEIAGGRSVLRLMGWGFFAGRNADKKEHTNEMHTCERLDECSACARAHVSAWE